MRGSVHHHVSSGRTFIISESTQFENLGDIVLNTVLIKSLAQRGAVLTLRSRKRAPIFFEKVLKETVSARLTPLDLLKRVLHQRAQGREQILCLNPGGVRGGLSVAWLLRTAMYVLMRAVGIRLMRVGVSLGPLTAGRRKLEAILTRLVDVIAVRDRLSLEELPVKLRQRIHLLPDLALLADDLGSPRRRCGPRSYLAVSLRLHDDAERAERYRRLLPPLSALAPAHGLELLFVAQVQQDKPLLADLARLSGADLRVLDADDEEALSRVIEVYSRCAVLITNRLHAGIFAAMNGCVPLALIDPRVDRKILGLMREAALTKLIHGETETDAALVARLDAVLANRAAHAAQIDRLVRVASRRGRQRLNRLILSPVSSKARAPAAMAFGQSTTRPA